MLTSTSVLQKFLDKQFIVPDQSDIAHLEKAADDFKKKLLTKRIRIPQAVLLAFDPLVSNEEPLFAEVQTLVVSKWRNFAGRCQDQPITYLRAVMLTALESLAADPRLAGIIWLTASNYFRYTTATHREAGVLESFLEGIGKVHEQAGWKSWEIGQSGKLPDSPVMTNSGLNEVKIITSEYAEKQMRASVIGVDSITSNSNSNIFHQVSGSYVSNGSITADEEWATAFGTIAGKAVTTVANGVVREVNKIIANATSTSQLNEYANKITQHLGDVAGMLSRQTASHNLRSNLLWLKETQYSVSQRKSYRSITQAARPIVLAYDAAQQVPDVYPTSVEYFLRETLAVADSQADDEQTFESLLIDLAAVATDWQAILAAVAEPEPGRRSLLSFVANLGQADNEINKLQQLTGLTPDATLTRADFAVWLFRELEVQSLIATK